VWHTLAGVRSAAVIRELGRAGFLAELDALVAVYAAAMNADPADVPGRRHIMQRHAGNPEFRALTASAGPAGPAGPVIAFAYGFRGQAGQWWHDVVLSAIIGAGGGARATAWMTDVMEIAEVHVHPDYQHRGTGRRMLLALTAGRAERTAVLSTRDADTTARRLYRGLGFADLLTGYGFPGGGPPYAVMGAVLPLRDVPGSGAPGLSAADDADDPAPAPRGCPPPDRLARPSSW
jgi:GNAT superfamily N-acetyltransferase